MNSPSSTTGRSGGESLARAYIGLGSNLESPAGTPGQTIEAALELIATWSAHPLQRSSLWCTEPIDCPPGSAPFINAVAGMVPMSDETPHSLLEKLLDLEVCFGRKRDGTLNAPRCLDLDLISFGWRQSADAELTLPHPLAHRRGFVLVPLAEIAPELRLPGQVRTVAELAMDLPTIAPLVVKIDTLSPGFPHNC